MNYPFEILVYVHRRPHMRCESLEYELHMGKTHLENLFDHERVDEKTTSLYFSYPERWLNIVEERSIYERVKLLYPNLKTLTIKTQSVYIIQCTSAKNIRIVSTEAEQDYVDKYGCLPQETETGKLWFPNAGNIINAKTLNVL
jgi:hypothetical protein